MMYLLSSSSSSLFPSILFFLTITSLAPPAPAAPSAAPISRRQTQLLSSSPSIQQTPQAEDQWTWPTIPMQPDSERNPPEVYCLPRECDRFCERKAFGWDPKLGGSRVSFLPQFSVVTWTNWKSTLVCLLGWHIWTVFTYMKVDAQSIYRVSRVWLLVVWER